jgi:hypothetical protein
MRGTDGDRVEAPRRSRVDIRVNRIQGRVAPLRRVPAGHVGGAGAGGGAGAAAEATAPGAVLGRAGRRTDSVTRDRLVLLLRGLAALAAGAVASAVIGAVQ